MMYAFSVELHSPFEKALEQVNQAIKEEGLGVVSDVDVQSIMHTKLQEDIAPYRILGACAPVLAKRAIEADPDSGALLPCSIIVRQIKPDMTGVTFMNPESVFGLAENEAVAEVGRQALALIEAVRDRLTGQHPANLID
jgi:uncharacterized protein (DUF302 family)